MLIWYLVRYIYNAEMQYMIMHNLWSTMFFELMRDVYPYPAHQRAIQRANAKN